MATKEEGQGTRRRTPPAPASAAAPHDEQARPRRGTRRTGAAEGAETATNPPSEITPASPTPRKGRPRRAADGREAATPETRASEPAAIGAPADAGPTVESVASVADEAATVLEDANGGAVPAARTPNGGEQASASDGDLDAAGAPDQEDTGEGGVTGAEETAREATARPEQPRRERHRAAHGNALGAIIERQFASPVSPCRSYSDLERHSGISREALSRYVTARPDRRRSPTIDTLVAIADAMHLSLESVARAAAASVKGVMPPPEEEQRSRQDVLGTLVAALTPEQFSAVVELLRQFRPVAPGS